MCAEVQSNFNDWLLRRTKGKEGKLIKYHCEENQDYKCLSEKSETHRKDGQKGISIKNKILLTLECAKKVAMRQNNSMGDLVCNYFILIEKVLKNNDQWCITRTTQKQGYKQMEEHIKQWCIRHEFDYSLRKFYIREANLLNENLFGHPAMEVNDLIDNDDTITRDHLPEEFNLALIDLQSFNIDLLCNDLSFEVRTDMIKKTCNRRYSNMKTDFEKFATAIRELRNKQ